MIIGLTGKYCCGKDAIADYLKTKSFRHISLSDIIRDMLREEGKKCTRENLINYANELRRKKGPGALARLALDKMEPNASYTITSIRNPTEIEVFKVMKNFLLVDVVAPVEQRFDRMQKRTRDDKLITLADFKTKEKEEQSDDPEKQQLHKCSEMAQIVVRNNGTLAALHRKIDRLLADWKPKLQNRPSWDEYFMGIVHAVASRGTCDRGRTATVIVRDKRILATGYVGAPMGLPDCDEIGHQMKKTTHEDGSESWHCVRTTHSELNAIALAARNGVAIEGATMYMKMAPCYTCAKVLINAGIKRVVCEKDYHATKDTKLVLKQAGVKLEILKKEVMEYAQQ